MDLGQGKQGIFSYVPEYGDNRELPETERLSLDIRPVRRIDLLAQMGWTESPEEVYKWRDETQKAFIDNPEYGELILQIPFTVLTGWRQFIGHCSGFRNFVFDGEEKTDPAEIFLLLAGEINTDGSLIGMIQNVITQTATLSGDALKNFKGECVGLSIQTNIAADANTDFPLPNAETPLDPIGP